MSDALLATARDARGEVPTSFVDALTAEPGLSSPAVAGATLLIGLLLVVATASLTGRDCPRIGAVLVLLGLAAVAITVRVRAVDLLPDRLGLAAAAAGTWHLGRVARSRWGAVAALAFGLAAFAAWTFPAAETLATCAGVVASFGLGSVLLRSIPHVGAAPPRRAVSARLRPALLVVLLVALGAGTYHSLAEASTQLGHAAVASTGLAVGLALGTAAPAFLDPRTRSVRRAISPAFVAMYVLPVGALLVATDDSTWAPAARYVALAGAVWCVARLLDAAWLHARRARTPTAVTSGRA